MKIESVENKVLDVLEEYPEARSDDFLLIFLTFKKFYEEVDMCKFGYVMLHHKALGLPSMHSITRARRKLFEKYPGLKPEKITELRQEKEEEFKKYALNS